MFLFCVTLEISLNKVSHHHHYSFLLQRELVTEIKTSSTTTLAHSFGLPPPGMQSQDEN